MIIAAKWHAMSGAASCSQPSRLASRPLIPFTSYVAIRIELFELPNPADTRECLGVENRTRATMH
jgi:hypothetical protein